MDQEEEIRFRVVDEVFVDTSPTGPAAAAATPDAPAQPGQSTAPPAEESGDKKEAPYTLVVRTVTFPFPITCTQMALVRWKFTKISNGFSWTSFVFS